MVETVLCVFVSLFLSGDVQGWTLLGATCPNADCYTPFVRNKQGQMYCVSCEQFAVTEEEAKQQREQQEKQQRDEAQAAKEELEREQRIHERFRADEAQQFERARAATHANGSGAFGLRCCV